MRALAGVVLTAEGWQEGHVTVADGRVQGFQPGPPPAPPVAEGVVVPAFVNAHTHIGDAVARGGPIPRDLVAAVAPPHSYKHRVLAAAPQARLVAGMALALQEMEACGTRGFLDFREGGVAGLDLLDQARAQASAAGLVPEARVYGRPAHGDTTPTSDEGRAELQGLLTRGQGLGLSALDDDPRAAALAEAARKAGKGFALHHAERERDPIEAALDLAPELLVHLTFAARSDLERVAEAGVGVAVCPRSNAYWLRRVPDVRAMLDLGIPVGLGTDNAMLGPCDLRAEACALLLLAPRVTPDEALAMLCHHGWRLLHPEAPRDPLASGAPADLLVFPRRHPGRKGMAWDVLAPDAAPLHRERPPTNKGADVASANPPDAPLNRSTR